MGVLITGTITSFADSVLVKQLSADSTLEDLKGNRALYAQGVLPRLVPDLERRATCPHMWCGQPASIGNLVMHLNDIHYRTYEQIAQWLDDLEATGKFDFTVNEPKQDNQEEDK